MRPDLRRNARIWWLASVITAAVAILIGGVVIAAANTRTATTSNRSAEHWPVIKLLAAQRSIVLAATGQTTPVDPGIWIASLGEDLQFDVRATNGTGANKVEIAQMVPTGNGHAHANYIPSTLLDGWNGLRDFVRMTIVNHLGKTVDMANLSFCPNSLDPERVTTNSAAASPFPAVCTGPNTAQPDPFQQAMVWGISKGWAVDPEEASPLALPLPLGTYQLTEAVTPAYVKLLHICSACSTASVKLTITNNATGAEEPHPVNSLSTPVITPPSTPSSGPKSEFGLPYLAALPAWDVGVSHSGGRDLLSFSATIWVGGKSPLDVEGFRTNSKSSTMEAYQYFWWNGHTIGRAPVGTMGFDYEKGYDRWHFQQFAEYRLLNSSDKLVMQSGKVGFCITSTDPINLLLPYAQWQPYSLGLDGQCGVPSAMWVREFLPVGWGDTYVQSLSGQAFDITNLANGVYYIEIIANPERALHVSTTQHDISLRKVILGGTAGHRTLVVPGVNGIDQEG